MVRFFDQKGSLARLKPGAPESLSVARTYSAFCAYWLQPEKMDRHLACYTAGPFSKIQALTTRRILRMKRQSFLVIIIVLLLMTACQKVMVPTPANNNSSTSTSTPDEFAAARASYDKNCKSCHMANGEGGTVKLDDGTKLKVPSLREGHALKHPDSDYVKQIVKGGDGMPAFGDKLKTDEINDLVRFIRHEHQGGMTPPAEPMMSPMKNMKTN
jgi:mono/diheme cytochrome c family protein